MRFIPVLLLSLLLVVTYITQNVESRNLNDQDDSLDVAKREVLNGNLEHLGRQKRSFQKDGSDRSVKRKKRCVVGRFVHRKFRHFHRKFHRVHRRVTRRWVIRKKFIIKRFNWRLRFKLRFGWTNQLVTMFRFNYRLFIKMIPNHHRNLWISRIRRIRYIIRARKFHLLRFNWLHHLRILTLRAKRLLLSKGKMIVKLRFYIRFLNMIKWRVLINTNLANKRLRLILIKRIRIMISITRGKRWKLLNWGLLATFHKTYLLLLRLSRQSKSRLVLRVRWLIRMNWRKVILHFRGLRNKQLWIRRIHLLIRVVRRGQRIRFNWLRQFTKLVVRVRMRVLKSKRLYIRIRTYIKLLIRFRWRWSLRMLKNHRLRLKYTRIITQIINRRGQRRPNITGKVYWKIRQILGIVKRLYRLRIRVSVNNRKIYVFIRRMRFFKKLNWIKIIPYIKNIQHRVWIRRIRKILILVKKRQYNRIRIRNFNRFKIFIHKFKLIIRRLFYFRTRFIPNITSIIRLNWRVYLRRIKVNRRIWTRRIRLIIRLIKTKQYRKINFKWTKKLIRVIHKIRIIHRKRPIKRINNKSLRRIKFIIRLKWRKYLKRIHLKNRKIWIRRIKRVIYLIKRKQYRRIRYKWTRKLIRIIHKIKVIQNKRPKVKITIKRINRKTIRKIKFIIRINWKKYIRRIHLKNRKIWIRRIKRVIRLVRRKQYRRIRFRWVRKVIRIIRRIKVIRKNRPTTKINRKVITKVIRRVKVIIRINWRKYLKKIHLKNRKIWIGRIKRIIRLVKRKQYSRIKFRWIIKLNRIIYKIKIISNNRPSRRDNKNKNVSKQEIAMLLEYGMLLRKWRWRILLKYFQRDTRVKALKYITLLLNILKTKQYTRISKGLIMWIKMIVHQMRQLYRQHLKTHGKTKITEVIRKLQVSLPDNWEQFIGQVTNINRKKWTYKLRALKSGQTIQIESGDAEIIERILTTIRRLSIKQKQQKYAKVMVKLRAQIKKLQAWNWESKIQYTKGNVVEVTKQLKSFIKVVESSQYEKLNENTIQWFEQIFVVLQQIESFIEKGYTYDKNAQTWVKQG